LTVVSLIVFHPGKRLMGWLASSLNRHCERSEAIQRL
jgi:hypothetical protein